MSSTRHASADDRPSHRTLPLQSNTDRDADSSREEGVALKERRKVQKPRLFKVLMHNDDYTTQVFVVDVLQTVFGYSQTQATQLMLLVHKTGMAVVGVYTREIAEAKIAKTTEKARAHGYPLKLTMEPE